MDGGIRQVTFRVEHDCPVARLSRDVDGELLAWSGHRFEVVAFRGRATAWPGFAAAAKKHLKPARLVQTPDGGFAVWHPAADPNASISRIIERHDMMWQQPLRISGGWEHYDAISFGAGEQAALDALRAQHPTQVARRRSLRPEEVTAAFFLSLQPALQAPTAKQAEALLAAHEAGYYESPRGATTAQVASRLGIGRSAFEERLRGGENRLMAEILPALAWQGGPGRL